MERWFEKIEGWTERQFSGGYAGLHDLADGSFSGAVSTGNVWVIFVNGRIVSIGERTQTTAGDEFEPGTAGPDGDIERFADAEGTAYAAPHPAVSLLVAMQLADGETRGSYYTEETPIAAVRETLSEGGFTGYVELSENVLSGDYYVVYQAGRSMEVAFVGNARRLKTGEAAADLTHDEVGIYEVVAAPLDVTDIPGSADRSATSAAAADVSDESSADVSDESSADVSDDHGTGESATDTQEYEPAVSPVDVEPTTDTGKRADSAAGFRDDDAESPAAGSTGGSPAGGSADADAGTADDTATDANTNTGTTADADTGATADTDDGRLDPGTPDPREVDRQTGDASTVAVASEAHSDSEQPGGSTDSPAQHAPRSIPSLDPEETGTSGEAGGTTSAGTHDGTQRSGQQLDTPAERTPAERTDPSRTESTDPSTDAIGEDDAGTQSRELRDDARAELQRVTAERNELIDERDELEAEVDRLRARVEELEAQVTHLGDGPSLSAAEALSETSLFVRYESKGRTTVEAVRDGSGSLEDLEANLRLSTHTAFESEGASVAGEPFTDWLHGSQRYRFVEWLVTTLAVEIRDTGSEDSMRDLYDALPRIGRVEFDATVPAGDEESPDDAVFDVVCRDQMGEPLVVANLDATREPVERAEMASLVKDAVSVSHGEASLAAAFYVTAAFFESPALQVASDATSRSLLSRDSRQSYVKESRKRGFHLGLVESRNGGFHLSVPDL